MTRLLFGLFFFAITSFAYAISTVQDRSPLQPGLWWDASRSGNGFDIHLVENKIFLVWYTYRPDGAPIWYSAQGALDGNNVLHADLLQHRWTNGRYDGNNAVGRVKLTRNHSESAKLEWSFTSMMNPLQFNAAQSNVMQPNSTGEWDLRPFDLAGIVAEVDHSGIWFDQANPGFGLSLSEREGFLLSAYYFYDANGAPTWALAQSVSPSSTPTPGGLPITQYRGSCPACQQRTIEPTHAGAVGFQFHTETDLSFHVNTVLDPNLPEWQLRNRKLSQLSKSVSSRSADRQLSKFGSDRLFDQTIRAAIANPPVVYSDFIFSASPPPTTRDVTTTNLQESDVDEGDLVKNDANTAYVFATNANGLRNGKIRAASINPGLGAVNEFQLSAASEERNLDIAQLYLDESRLIAITSEGQYGFGDVGLLPYPGNPLSGETDIEIFDRSNALNPRSIWRAKFDGSLVSSRKIGSQLYLVKRYAPVLPNYRPFATDPAVIAENQNIINSASLTTLLPTKRINNGVASAVVAASEVLLPPVSNRVITAQYVIVTRINLANPSDQESSVMLGSVDAIYVSAKNIYLATSRAQPNFDTSLGLIWNGYSSTDIHQIPLLNGRVQPTASGVVEGFLDRGFDDSRGAMRFSEHNDALRVMTVGNHFGASGVNRLSVLSPSTVVPGVLRTESVLPNNNRPEPIGKIGEFLYATRFAGERLYAVTFLTIDPLYVIDIANARDPKIVGQLEIPGYSDYLHPLDNNLLLGFGKDALADSSFGDGRGAWYQGLQISLFDVSNPAQPRQLQNLKFGKRGSESAVLQGHHGLSILRTDFGYQFAVPMRLHDGVAYNNPSQPWAWYPFAQSVLQPIEIRSGFAGWSMITKPALVTGSAPEDNGERDDAGYNARSILFNDRLIYVENGRFWSAPWQTPNLAIGPR